jgi:hypothetical protein
MTWPKYPGDKARPDRGPVPRAPHANPRSKGVAPPSGTR